MNRSSGISEHEGVREMEEALREFGSPVMPVDSPEVLVARRNRTVSHLRALQARAVVRGQDARLWRRRFLIAALVLFPTGALAATWAAFRESAGHGVRAETEGKDVASKSAYAGRATRRVSASSSHASEPAPSNSEATGDPIAPASLAMTRREFGSAASLVGPNRTASAASFSMTAGKRAAESSPVGPSVASFRSFPDGAEQGTQVSTLGAENALMQAAMAAARAGDDSRAILRFSDFLARYPKSPLAENASVERLRALSRLRAAAGLASGDPPRP